MHGLDGRTILVTGASGGIGGEIVRQLRAVGADVLASGPDLESLEAIVSATGARACPFDVTSEDEVRSAIEGTGLYGVVNCAGWGGVVSPLTEADAGTFDRLMDINARGTLTVTKYASQEMIRLGGGGAIVNVSSQAARVALTGHGSYGASKAAVDALTRVAALELGMHGIRVNSVSPTVVMTAMSADYWGRGDIGVPFLEMMPLRRWATEKEIAAPIVFLLGDGAAMITGACLPIDGGYTCR